MKSTGSFKRILAVLCTAALLTCSVSALAVSPADVSASASLSAVNSVSEAQLRSALSKLTVTYDSEDTYAGIHLMGVARQSRQHGKGLLRSVPLPVRYQR